MLFLLIIAALIPVLCPFLALYLDKGPHAARFNTLLDGLVLVMVLGLILLMLLPEALAHAGVKAMPLAFLAFLAPWLLERFFRHSERATHRFLLLIACLALVMHGASDGLIFSWAATDVTGYWTVSVLLLHRLGVGLALWWLMRPLLGQFFAFLLLALLGLVTLLGYAFAEYSLSFLAGHIVGLWQALAAGSLLHILLHPLAHRHIGKEARDLIWAHRAGTALGVLFIAAFLVSHALGHGGAAFNAIAGTSPHGLDRLISLGPRIAPFALFILWLGPVIWLWRPRQRERAFSERLQKGLLSSLPFSLAFVLFSLLLPLLIPDWFGQGTVGPLSEVGGLMSLILWVLSLVGLLIWRGARSFLQDFFRLLQLTPHHHDTDHDPH